MNSLNGPIVPDSHLSFGEHVTYEGPITEVTTILGKKIPISEGDLIVIEDITQSGLLLCSVGKTSSRDAIAEIIGGEKYSIKQSITLTLEEYKSLINKKRKNKAILLNGNPKDGENHPGLPTGSTLSNTSPFFGEIIEYQGPEISISSINGEELTIKEGDTISIEKISASEQCFCIIGQTNAKDSINRILEGNFQTPTFSIEITVETYHSLKKKETPSILQNVKSRLQKILGKKSA